MPATNQRRGTNSSPATAQQDAMASTESEVRALLDSRSEAVRTKDIDRLMSLYSPDIVYFDVVPPLQYTGSAALRGRFLEWFDGFRARSARKSAT